MPGRTSRPSPTPSASACPPTRTRVACSAVANQALQADLERRLQVVSALHMVLDLELAIMLETYREAFVDKVQHLERLQSSELAVRIRRAERLASLGTMAAGLAHEIRNPLNAAHLQLSVARRRLARAADDGGVAEPIEVAAAELARLAGLVEDFLLFARPQTLRLVRGDLRAFARQAAGRLAAEIGAAGATLEVADGDAVNAEFDPEKLNEVLDHLVRNAMDAAGRGGRISITVDNHSGSARLSVEDDGPGFPPDAPVFEPFYSTKPGGTGLGLAIVHRVVADHGGSVTAMSRPGNGAVFSVLLPIGHTLGDGGTLSA